MAGLTQEAAERLVGSAGRRAGGSRGVRARWAWWRVVRRCAAGDAAVQDAVRAVAGSLPEADALELAAAAPAVPADRAAYLALIGQGAQRAALDPDGSLLALAYRAAAAEVRERLRAVMAAEGDSEVIRVVVSGDQRERVAEMSRGEVDYLAGSLAEHGRWGELRRLALDLPLDRAVAAARLLPADERTGDGAELLAVLAGGDPEALRGTVERLPRERYTVHGFDCDGNLLASFSPDSSELAVRSHRWGKKKSFAVETLRIGTGAVTRRFEDRALPGIAFSTVLHLGDEILLDEYGVKPQRIIRAAPDRRLLELPPVLGPRSGIGDVRRSSRGAVVLLPGGLGFADRGAKQLRYVPVPRVGDYASPAISTLATLPAHGLVAVFSQITERLLILDEDGEVLDEQPPWAYLGGRFSPALTFLSPGSLAVHEYANASWPTARQHVHRCSFTGRDGAPAAGAPQVTPNRTRWLPEEWNSRWLDDEFARRIMAHPDGRGRLRDGLSWLQSKDERDRWRWFLTADAGKDVFVTTEHGKLEIHSPLLPAARALLEQPMVRCTLKDLQRARELHAGIGGPDVLAALDLLAHCLVERFGGDIELGSAGRGDPTDIALGEG